MIVEVVNTGTELLLGEILNTNFQYLSRQLNKLGYDVLYQTTVGDNETRLRSVLEIALERADIVITTGGLGPTRGDITKEVIADMLGLEMYLDLDTWDRINSFFLKKGLCMSSNNDKQAMVPLGAEILINEVGTAPGLVLEHNGKLIVLLPGPPSELNYVCEQRFLPLLMQRYAQQGIIYSRILKMRGIGESSVAAQLDDIITSQSNPTIAIYERLSKFIYGVDDASLAEYLGQELLKSGSTIAFAESCTGGLASSIITDIPGSSEYLLGSVVTYSNMAKQKLVNVSAENLEKYGAVSEQVACEMASGVRDLFGTTYGVGITGIAGPGGATEEKPVGLVYMAVADGNDVHCVKHLFGGTRTENKLRSALTAISMVIDKIKARRNEEI